MRKLILFGADTLASLIAFQLQKLHGQVVAGFTLDDDYLTQTEFEGLPVVGFCQLEKRFSPESHDVILPLGYHRMNALRAERLAEAKNKGFSIGNFVSNHACILSNSEIKENVLIFEQAILQPYAKLGANIIIRSGANIGHHSSVGDHTFIASGAVTGGNVIIGEQCFIGLGAVIRDNIKIADRTFIGAGAVVVKNTEPDGVYIGNPARKLMNKTSLDVTG